jgi:orotidine-5'-phosphate decarboxylase
MKLSQAAFPLKNPLCVALDVDDLFQAEKIVDQIGDFVGGVKLGPRLLLKYGHSLIKKFSDRLPVFVDCKFFDIPSTMEASVKTVADAGASLITVHALSGLKSLSLLAQVELTYPQLRILAVTALTSWEDSEVQRRYREPTASGLVVSLCEDVQKSGLRSVVCSAQELSLIQSYQFYCVTPGIRFALQEQSDQSRIASPMQAIKEGANVLVVGRPIVQSNSPREAAMDFMAAIFENKT